MSCKPTYKGKRYNSLEELYKANGVNPQQKQQAQTKFQEYVDATGRQDIEGFKEFVNKPNQKSSSITNEDIKPGVSELFESNPELANQIYEALGFKIRSTAGEFSYHYGGDEKSLYEVMKYYDAAIVNKENSSKFDKFSILISDFLRNYITEDSDIKIRFLNFGSEQSAASFFGENITAHYNVKRNTIFINEDRRLTNTDTVNTINHEIIHAITFYLYNNNVDFKSRLDRLYNYSIQHVNEIDRKYYGFKNELEFIAEAISNPDFAGLLDTIKSTNKNNIGKSLLDEIIEVVKDALKVFKRGLLSEDRSVLNDIFELINEYHLDKNDNVVTEQQKQQAQQAYSQYLDTIFPDSKVKDIVYHGSKSKFDKFDYNYLPKADAGFYFTKDKKYAKNFGNPIPVLLHVVNPNYTEEPLSIETVERLFTTEYKESTDSIIGKDAVLDLPQSDADVIVTMHDKQIHILGSKQDIKEFKEFVSNTKSRKDVNNNREVNNLNFNTLDSETLKALKDKEWTEEMWNSVSQIEREQAIKCISF